MTTTTPQPPRERQRLGAPDAAWIAALTRVEPGWVACAALIGIVVLGALGIVHVHEPTHLTPFDLDREWTVPAAFSALLLAGAAVTTEALRRQPGLGALLGLVILFAFISVDEIVSIHERLETWVGISWEILYLPIFAFGAVAWLVAFRRVEITRVRVMMVAAAGFWALATLLEKVAWDSHHHELSHYNTKMVTEELSEMTGSMLFLIAFLIALRAARAGAGRSSRPGPDESPTPAR